VVGVILDIGTILSLFNGLDSGNGMNYLALSSKSQQSEGTMEYTMGITWIMATS